MSQKEFKIKLKKFDMNKINKNSVIIRLDKRKPDIHPQMIG